MTCSEFELEAIVITNLAASTLSMSLGGGTRSRESSCSHLCEGVEGDGVRVCGVGVEWRM